MTKINKPHVIHLVSRVSGDLDEGADPIKAFIDTFPECLEITAESDEDPIMALRHREYDIHGIQFHSESVLTPEGKNIISNFLKH